MQVMEKKGLLKHTRRGVTHVYRPAMEKHKILRPFVRKVVTEVFGGRPTAVMQALLDDGQLSDEELAEMRKLLDEAQASGKQ